MTLSECNTSSSTQVGNHHQHPHPTDSGVCFDEAHFCSFEPMEPTSTFLTIDPFHRNMNNVHYNDDIHPLSWQHHYHQVNFDPLMHAENLSLIHKHPPLSNLTHPNHPFNHTPVFNPPPAPHLYPHLQLHPFHPPQTQLPPSSCNLIQRNVTPNPSAVQFSPQPSTGSATLPSSIPSSFKNTVPIYQPHPIHSPLASLTNNHPTNNSNSSLNPHTNTNTTFHSHPNTNYTQQQQQQQRLPHQQPTDSALTLLPLNHSLTVTNSTAISNASINSRDAAALPEYLGLEKFKLLEKLGEGAFSQVYHALDLEKNTDVAIKVIDKLHMSPYQRLAVQNEVSIHSKLKHPNIIALNHHFETACHFFLIMEWMSGGEIFQKIVDLTFFSEELARHVIVQVGKGIHHLHHVVGVVHRDIKPENILFQPIPTSDFKKVPSGRTPREEKRYEDPYIPGIGGGGIGVVKLADFGLSKIIWKDGTQTPCGTVGYTAPEIVKSQKYTTSVDLWALGCVLYTLLCGFPPFYDDDNSKLSNKVAKGEWTFLKPWWDNVSSSAKDLVSKLLEVCPEKRYSINDFFMHPWVRQSTSALVDVPSTLPPPAPLPAKFDWKSFVLPPLRTPEIGTHPSSPTPSQKQLKHYFDASYKIFHNMHERGSVRPDHKDFDGNTNFKLNLAEASILKNRRCRKALD